METKNKIFIQRRFSCAINELFAWLTHPELISQWFGPKHMKVVSAQTDVCIGGQYTIKLSRPDGSSFIIEGEYIEIEAPIGITITMRYKGLSGNPPQSIVKIQLDQTGENETSLSLTQNFEFTPADIENRTQAWEHMFSVLTKQLAEHGNYSASSPSGSY